MKLNLIIVLKVIYLFTLAMLAKLIWNILVFLILIAVGEKFSASN